MVDAEVVFGVEGDLDMEFDDRSKSTARSGCATKMIDRDR